jgi:TolB protein
MNRIGKGWRKARVIEGSLRSMSIAAATAIWISGVVACDSPMIPVDNDKPPVDSLGQQLPPIESPLRDKIVFQTDEFYVSGNVSIIGVDGTGLVAFTRDSVGTRCPAVSPDGTMIAFQRDSGLYVVDANRANLRRLPSGGAGYPRCPSWSSDSRRIAFIEWVLVSKAPSPTTLFVVNVDGTGLVPVVRGSNITDVWWSPDGKRLLYSSSSYSGNGGPYDFLTNVVSADGSEVIHIASGTWGASWSPSGDRVAFICRGPYPWQVCVANSAGTGVKPITSSAESHSDPSWSPDGKYVLFRCGGGFCKSTPDGADVQQILPASLEPGGVQWSPDSENLAFSCKGSVRLSPSAMSHDICVTNPDGTGLRRLSTYVAQNGSPSWSPQSR